MLCVMFRLFEAEQRYRSRESRPEDIEYIRKLKKAVTEQEVKIKQLMVRHLN